MHHLTKALLIITLLTLTAAPVWSENDSSKPQSKIELSVTGLLDCSNAIPIQCGESVDGDNTNSPNNVELYSCTSWNEAGGEDVYEIYLDNFYQVDIEISNLAADLDVFLLTTCDEADCTANGDTNINGGFGPGTFYIVVDGYSGAASAYTLTVNCELPPEPDEEDGSICDFFSVCYDWNFNESDWGFIPEPCDPAQGAPVWQYGLEATVPGSPGNVWATVLNGNYLSSAGDGLYSPMFTVTPECSWMEVKHYVFTEGYISSSGNIYDGGNVTVDDIVIPPVEGYTGVCNQGSAACVLQEEVFAGNVSDGVPIRSWGRSCFDLSQFMNMTIRVRFDFGSDSSVTRPGWYLEYVKLGNTDSPIPTEGQTWGTMKALFR
jgi:hypothetical protein